MASKEERARGKRIIIMVVVAIVIVAVGYSAVTALMPKASKYALELVSIEWYDNPEFDESPNQWNAFKLKLKNVGTDDLTITRIGWGERATFWDHTETVSITIRAGETKETGWIPSTTDDQIPPGGTMYFQVACKEGYSLEFNKPSSSL